MPRYTLRDLFLATTLIAMGVAGCVWFKQLGGFYNAEMFQTLLIPLESGALLGAGFFAPFQKTSVGALIGLLVVGVFIVVIVPATSPIRGQP